MGFVLSLRELGRGLPIAVLACLILLSLPAIECWSDGLHGFEASGAMFDANALDQVNRQLGLRRSDVTAVRIASLPGPDWTASLRVAGNDLVLDLHPVSVFADGYRLYQQVADGRLVECEPGPTRTVRGSIRGVPGSQVAGAVAPDGLYAVIVLPDGTRTWIQPIPCCVHEPERDLHIVHTDDEIEPLRARCGVGDPQAHRRPADQKPDQAAEDAAPSMCSALLACDADFEYFIHYGSVEAVEARIALIVNTVNLQFQTEVGIRHLISSVIVRTSEPDPYTQMEAQPLANQFRQVWNQQHTDIERDLAHLFTGKTLVGEFIGYAYDIGSVCNTFNAYCVAQSDWGGFSCATDLTAHELGHLWNAVHCQCPFHTMYPDITCANTFHPRETVPDILAFRDSLPCPDCGPPCDLVWNEAEVMADDFAAGDRFGDSIDVAEILGDAYLAAGARLDDHAAGTNAGSAYVFRRGSTAQWPQHQKLIASDAAAGDQFGAAVAMDIEHLIVGSPREDNAQGTDAGAAYVFAFDGTGWVEAAKLVAQVGASQEWFGNAVALEDDVAIVGAPLTDIDGTVDCGAAHVFRLSDGLWAFEQRLTAPDGGFGDGFGDVAAIAADHIAIGAPLAAASSGVVYTFRYLNGSWLLQQVLTSPQPTDSDRFGAAIAVRDGYLLVGAPGDDARAIDAGAAYVFEFDGRKWVPSQQLISDHALPYAGFGDSVALTSDFAIVGEPAELGISLAHGGAYLFIHSGQQWPHFETITGFSPDDALFGTAVAMGPGGIAAIGASLTVVQTMPNVGTAFAFSIPTAGDCDANGAPDTCDLLEGTTADCNRDQALDACQIAEDPSLDVDQDGQLDECEADCNQTGLPDDYEISIGRSQDCNGNGVPDECDLAEGASKDCNANFIPDECEDAFVEHASGMLSPLTAGVIQVFSIPSLGPLVDDVTLSFAAVSDLSFSSEHVTVDLNGVVIGQLWATPGAGHDCPLVPDTATLIVPLATWQSAVRSERAVIQMTPSAGVDGSLCTGSTFISCTASFVTFAPDDLDADGQLDSCKPLVGDLDGDGDVDGLDLALLLGQWTGAAAYSPCTPPAPADLNADCKINGLDLAILLGQWS